MHMTGDGFGWALLIGIGAFAGFCSGLLGMGGGVVIIPAVVFTGPLIGITSPDLAKIAMASSSLWIIPTAIASLQGHISRGSVDWGLWALLAPCVMAGGLGSALVIQHLNPTLLVMAFAGIALISAWRLIRPRAIQAGAQRMELTMPRLTVMAGQCCLGGTFSSALGLGVAVFVVPMLARHVLLPQAIGTAAALALPASLMGATGFLFAPTPAGCDSCTGYVHLPAVVALAIGAILAAPIGAQLTSLLPVQLLRRTFAAMLVLGAVSLIVKQGPHLSLGLPGLAASSWPTDGAPASAPGWLRAPRHPAGFVLARRYGPRLGLLPLMTGRSSPPALPLVVRQIAVAGTRRQLIHNVVQSQAVHPDWRASFDRAGWASGPRIATATMLTALVRAMLDRALAPTPQQPSPTQTCPKQGPKR
jgi:uncharacterized membrane protein YfcA